MVTWISTMVTHYLKDGHKQSEGGSTQDDHYQRWSATIPRRAFHNRQVIKYPQDGHPPSPRWSTKPLSAWWSTTIPRSVLKHPLDSHPIPRTVTQDGHLVSPGRSTNIKWWLPAKSRFSPTNPRRVTTVPRPVTLNLQDGQPDLEFDFCAGQPV